MNHITVKDLIKQLQKLKDQNAIVVVATSNFEQGNNKVKASGISEFKGKLETESFRDAFDGGSYSKEIVRWDDKGKTNFIEIC